MEIKNGKIKNINRRLIASILSFTMISSMISGCSISRKIRLERQKYENFTGVASFEKLRKSYFIGVQNTEGETNFYIAERITGENEDSYFYIDLIEGRNVYVTKDLSNFTVDNNQKLVNEINVEDYLYDFKMIEEMYSEEDINKLLTRMKELNVINNKSK